MTIVACCLALTGCGGAEPGDADAQGVAVDGGVGADSGSQPDVDYERLFPLDHVADVHIDFEPGGWATLLEEPLEDVYVPASVTYDGVHLDQVGVRFKGNSSRKSVEREGGVRYSLKLDIDMYIDGQSLLGVDKINLNNGFMDPTQLRELVTTELYRGAGIPSPQMGFVRVFLDGELHGNYTAVEQVDKEFLRRHFADDDGDLYKPEPPTGHLEWLGDDVSAYAKLELKTNEDTSDQSAILHFLDVLNNTPADAIETALPAVFDVDAFLRYLAVTTLTVNLDSIVGPGHNYYLYEDRSSGKFILLPWDMNMAFGGFSCDLAPEELVAYPYLQPACTPVDQKILVAKVMGVASFRATYESYLHEYASGHMAAAPIGQRLSELATVLRPYVAADPTRFFSAEEFEQNLASDLARGPSRVFFGVTSFVDRRLDELDDQLGDGS
jgi:hypothetical protein